VQLQGEYVVHAPRERVWQLLNDPAVLARITPGVTSLIPEGGEGGEGTDGSEGNDRYKATFVVALGPFKNTFNGRVEVADKQPPEAMTLKVQARGPGGGVAATGRITLSEDESDPGATRVAYTGEPQLSGVLATVGARLVQGASKSQADQFFASLEREATSA
jgi:carbon monoxide dehydrogenase subunit G